MERNNQLLQKSASICIIFLLHNSEFPLLTCLSITNGAKYTIFHPHLLRRKFFRRTLYRYSFSKCNKFFNELTRSWQIRRIIEFRLRNSRNESSTWAVTRTQFSCASTQKRFEKIFQVEQSHIKHFIPTWHFSIPKNYIECLTQDSITWRSKYQRYKVI